MIRVIKYLSIIRNWFPKKYYSLNMLDKRLLEYLNFKNGFYVELGANDGRTQSNTYYFEKNLNWRGLLIEPIPRTFNKLIINRHNSNIFEQVACVGADYKEDTIDIWYSNLMSIAVDPRNEIRDTQKHALIGSKYLENESPYILSAPALTLTKLFEKNNVPKLMNLLSLDVEGYELEVLRGIDHDRYRFDYILVESRNTTEMESYLNEFNYKLIDQFSYHDYLFMGIK